MNRVLIALALSASVALASALTISGPKSGQPAETEADKAYAELQKAFVIPATPESWRKKAPTTEERAAFNKAAAEHALEAVLQANAFAEEYGDYPRLAEVRKNSERMRLLAIRYGADVPPGRAAFEAKAKMLQASAVRQEGAQIVTDYEALERGARELQKEFPFEPRVFDILQKASRGLNKSAARAVFTDIVASPLAEPETRLSAAGQLKGMGILGQALEMQFTSVQGKPVNVSQMKGKVILIDFWATWCGPCKAEMPNVKQAYAELHGKGFEIVGISFDENRARLLSYIQQEGLPWPQYFDGLRWGNRYRREFGITGIPTMWLVDKKGVVRDVKARENLKEKIEALLAEQ